MSRPFWSWTLLFMVGLIGWLLLVGLVYAVLVGAAATVAILWALVFV